MLLDTSVWVELFLGTNKGKEVEQRIKSGVPVYTCPLSLAELSIWSCRNKKDLSFLLQTVKTYSQMTDLNEHILVRSGMFYFAERQRRPKIGIVDCIIYASCRMHGLPLLTTDRDFTGLPGVELL